MAAQPLSLSLEEFHRLYDGAKPAYEYWYGKAIRKPMPTILHGIVQMLISMLLERAGWNTASEVRLKVSPDAEPVPDVIAVKGKFRGRYPTTPPELCIEIMSPSDTLSKALEKAGRYILLGTQSVWILDPEKRTAWVISRENPLKPEWIPPSGALHIQETRIDLPLLFAEVDRKLELSED